MKIEKIHSKQTRDKIQFCFVAALSFLINHCGYSRDSMHFEHVSNWNTHAVIHCILLHEARFTQANLISRSKPFYSTMVLAGTTIQKQNNRMNTQNKKLLENKNLRGFALETSRGIACGETDRMCEHLQSLYFIWPWTSNENDLFWSFQNEIKTTILFWIFRWCQRS